MKTVKHISKTRADAEGIATSYHLAGNENFIEYLRTLGLRTNANQAKASFSLVDNELAKRGF